MADPISILSGAIKTLQKLREITQKIKNADLLNFVGDLTLNLADLKLQVAELQQENASLRDDLKRTAENASFRHKLILKDGLYHFKQPEENRPDGPYCTRCFDVEQKLVLVSLMSMTFRQIAKYTCPNCKAQYA